MTSWIRLKTPSRPLNEYNVKKKPLCKLRVIFASQNAGKYLLFFSVYSVM